MYQLRLLLAVISFSVLHSSQAQELFPFQNFTPEMYHGETQNWDISQSDTKLIYLANNKGLLEFNGSRWTLYPSPNRTIMRSVFAKGKRIYTGCYQEFGYWVKDEFLNLKYTSLSREIKNKLLEDEQFWNIIGYQQWILFQSLHRIYIFDTVQNTFRIINSKPNLPKIFPVGNQIYFQKKDEGVFRLENGKTLLISDAPVLRDNIIINIFDYRNKLLIQTQEKGFYIFENGQISQWHTPATSKINSLSIYCSLQLHDGSFVLGTIGEGVYLMSKDGTITTHIDKESGLQNNTVLSLFEDADNNIWFGLDNGIGVLNYTSPFRVFNDTKGVFGTVYAAAFHQNNLYVGTNQGLFYKTAKTNDNFKLIDGTKGQVWVLKVIDNTLFCGHNSGTFIVTDDKADLVCNQLGTWDIQQLISNPNLLIQGNYEGLNILEKSTGNWRYRNKIQGFDISSRNFEMMPNNQIFVNHEYKSVYKLDITSDYGKIKKVEIDTTAPQSSNSGLVKYNGKLLYFAESGIYEYQEQKKRFIKEKEFSKLILEDDSYLSGKILQSKDQTYWAFTRDNIIAITSGKINNKPNIHRVALPLFLRENVVGFENLLHLDNDIYLLGNTNGYILFNLNELTDKEYIIQLSSIEKNRLNKEASYIPVLSKNYRLRANENNIKFSYNVPEFDKFTFSKYQYRLEGLYDNWSEWTNEAEIAFKNLPSGKYTFQVRAKVGNKITTNIVSFRFIIANHWYASGWMLLVYAALFILLIFIINRVYRIRYNKKAEKIKQDKKLMQLINEKEISNLKNENLNCEIESVNRELNSATMAVIKKNELLSNIRLKLQKDTENPTIKSAIKIIDENLDNTGDWKSFQTVINNTDRDFLKKIKELHPALTPNDLKLCAYLRLNLSSKEIAPMLNISPQSVEVKRFRLRKKMELNHQENLTDYILII